jgi:uncharacterized membrane protein HdeD (DUF308 family)
MTAASAAPASAYPVSVDFERPLEVPRWRPLVNWLLVIPQLIVVQVLGFVYGVLALVSFFTVLFTKQVPDGIFGVQAMIDRYSWRVTSFHLFMGDEYPPFSFATTAADDGIYSARYAIQEPGEMNRWLPLIKWLLVIPHYIVLLFLFIGVAVVALVSFFVVLFTGKYSEGMRNYIIGVERWALRVSAYATFRTDVYPPFRLSA